MLEHKEQWMLEHKEQWMLDHKEQWMLEHKTNKSRYRVKMRFEWCKNVPTPMKGLIVHN